jgi:hypothetical protein
VHLWAYGGGANQQWQAVEESGGGYHFVRRNSGKCLDVPSASSADSVQLQQYACNGSGARSFTLSPVGVTTPTPGAPDLGPNVLPFDPSMSSSAIQGQLNNVFHQQETNQFGSNRYALLFKPGSYNVDVNVGFYTQVLGLGLSPDDVTINGAAHAEADWLPPKNATQNFWRGAENLSVNPNGGTDRWAVSQAAPYRRMHVRGNLALDAGGWISDTKIDGQVRRARSDRGSRATPSSPAGAAPTGTDNAGACKVRPDAEDQRLRHTPGRMVPRRARRCRSTSSTSPSPAPPRRT